MKIENRDLTTVEIYHLIKVEDYYLIVVKIYLYYLIILQIGTYYIVNIILRNNSKM
jgi:hypothetical protein